MIPEDLFNGIQGQPQEYTFNGTFYGCSNLTGKIPGHLLSGIRGPSSPMFAAGMFQYCTGLTEIDENLFSGIAPDVPLATSAFTNTFMGCSNLTGYSPKINGKYLYEIWPTASKQYTYRNCTKLTDYASIPTNWK